MPRSRAFAVPLVAALGIAVAELVSCREPTQVTLEITTDQPCGVLDGVTIAAAETPAGAAAGAWSTLTRDCAPTREGGSFGTIVLTPSGAKDSAFAVQVVGSIGASVETCGPTAPARAAGTGCITARRALTYIPHTPLYLPITLRRSCLNVECNPDQTCARGLCVSAQIDQPAECAIPGACAELGDGGVVSDGASGSDAGDASARDASDAGVTADAGPCRLSAFASCRSATTGSGCAEVDGGSPLTCPTNACCATANSVVCRPFCIGGGSPEYEFDCDEPEDCAPGEYCIANATAGPDAGARCQPPALACQGARVCKDSCECDANQTCSGAFCPVTVGVTTIHVYMKTCGGVCP